jgi:transcription initiation factor IIE alpha subunit
MSKFKEAKVNSRRKKITETQRNAAKKNRLLEGFQCPHKRCMHVLQLDAYKQAPADHVCGRCGSSVEDFTPVMVDHRKIVPKDILQHDNATLNHPGHPQ